MSYVAIPTDAGNFLPMDRKVVDALNALPERDCFLRGLRAWLGFRQSDVPYVRFLGGVQLLCRAVIGEYLGRVSDEVKQRPLYLVKSISNDPRPK